MEDMVMVVMVMEVMVMEVMAEASVALALERGLLLAVLEDCSWATFCSKIDSCFVAQDVVFLLFLALGPICYKMLHLV